MARTLYFTDGSCQVLFCRADDTGEKEAALEGVLYEHLGTNAAALFREIIGEHRAEIQKLREEFLTCEEKND